MATQPDRTNIVDLFPEAANDRGGALPWLQEVQPEARSERGLSQLGKWFRALWPKQLMLPSSEKPYRLHDPRYLDAAERAEREAVVAARVTESPTGAIVYNDENFGRFGGDVYNGREFANSSTVYRDLVAQHAASAAPAVNADIKLLGLAEDVIRIGNSDRTSRKDYRWAFADYSNAFLEQNPHLIPPEKGAGADGTRILAEEKTTAAIHDFLDTVMHKLNSDLPEGAKKLINLSRIAHL